ATEDIITVVKNFFTERITTCINAGIARERIILDPGIGHGKFGKNTAQNLRLIRHLSEFTCFKLPILVGVSHKTFIGKILGLEPQDRLFGSIAAAVMAVERGASIIRAHDVKATVEAIRLATAILEGDTTW